MSIEFLPRRARRRGGAACATGERGCLLGGARWAPHPGGLARFRYRESPLAWHVV